MLLATALLIIGLLLVVYSADRLVFAASILCRSLGIPPLIIGMTVVSVGTSLPEIIVSVTAYAARPDRSRHRNGDRI
jgi:Ca2+/Na+ antiporter